MTEQEKLKAFEEAVDDIVYLATKQQEQVITEEGTKKIRHALAKSLEWLERLKREIF